VAFDDQGHLLTNTIQEKEAHIASMQHFISIVHIAVGLMPCMVADEEYQCKHYGILGRPFSEDWALAP
jgi:hypothetical protein